MSRATVESLGLTHVDPAARPRTGEWVAPTEEEMRELTAAEVRKFLESAHGSEARASAARVTLHTLRRNPWLAEVVGDVAAIMRAELR